MYKPGEARVGEPTPQDHPELFTDAEILAEIEYLIRLDRRHGTHFLRAAARLRLADFMADRSAGGLVQVDDRMHGPDCCCPHPDAE